MKEFIQLIIQQKGSVTSNDFRAFVIAKDAQGLTWELRGYGATAEAAAKNGWENFVDDQHWDVYGCTVAGNRKCYIYALLDEKGIPFYVGKTFDVNKRLNRHTSLVRQGSKLYVHNKLRKVLTACNGFKDLKARSKLITALVETTEADADRLEISHISEFKRLGFKLTNLTSGGEGGKGFSPEQQKAAALKRVGQKRSKLTRLRISLAKKGQGFSESHKRQLKIARNKRPLYSQAQRVKMSKASIGRINVKQYTLKHADGTIIKVTGLTQFCKEKGLHEANLHRAMKQKKEYHGWVIIDSSERFTVPRKASPKK